ncbi:MAG: NAD(P)/FAD-dependent oxidoreductase [Solirubrobacterales bacterium]|nr:NAD(P)/FAD-dependent oxidoreductase [Solirubrobacterales bacterium]
MAIRLKQQGHSDFIVLERGSSVGGTWRDNTYPGCACDIPSHLYSLSFAPNPGWSNSFSTQPEIWAYLKRVAEESGVLDHTRFNCEVTDARWNESVKRWILQTATGEIRCQVLVAGIGGLITPRLPAVPGLEDFEGEVFHSARWNHDYDLEGKRVAAIGTGASAIQFVPKIQPEVEQLHLFQRTPAWLVPRDSHPFSSTRRRLYARFPALARLHRRALYWSHEALILGYAKQPKLMRIPQAVGERHLRSQINDPELRRKLTPDYTFGCKRALVSNDFYPAVAQDNVELLTEGLAEVRGNRVFGSQGTEREVDAIILGTGFETSNFPGAAILHGRDGRNLTETWDGAPIAHRTTTMTGFPNLFILGGPNFGTGHMSVVEIFEHQYAYILDALEKMDRDAIASVDAREDAMVRFNEEVDRKMARTVWMKGGCQSYYIDRSGRNSSLWPDWTFEHARMTKTFDLSEYDVERVEAGHQAPEQVFA